MPLTLKANCIKLELDMLMQLTKDRKQPFSSLMTIGVIPSINSDLLPKVLP